MDQYPIHTRFFTDSFGSENSNLGLHFFILIATMAEAENVYFGLLFKEFRSLISKFTSRYTLAIKN